MVLDQGIDTSTAVGRMFFQILGAIAEFSVKWTGWGSKIPELVPAA